MLVTLLIASVVMPWEDPSKANPLQMLSRISPHVPRRSSRCCITSGTVEGGYSGQSPHNARKLPVIRSRRCQWC